MKRKNNPNHPLFEEKRKPCQNSYDVCEKVLN